MNEAQRKERNTQRVAELWPSFGARIVAVVATLEGQGFDREFKMPGDLLRIN